jgi:uncharacterized membrane protein (UPF0127 family)
MLENRWWRWFGCCALFGAVLTAAGMITAAPVSGGEDPLDTALITLPDGVELVVELAVTPLQRSRGLMFRDELPAGQGMLLVFPDTGFRSIWMKNVRFPLDLIWLDRSHRVVHFEKNVPPCAKEPCPDYHSLRKAASVLELNAGAVETLGIQLGHQLEIIPPLP